MLTPKIVKCLKEHEFNKAIIEALQVCEQDQLPDDEEKLLFALQALCEGVDETEKIYVDILINFIVERD